MMRNAQAGWIKAVVLLGTHLGALAVGFALGIYALPILLAPPSPTDAELATLTSRSEYSGQFVRELQGSDALHWGEGTVSVGSDFIALEGSLAPGPDYKLYLSPTFVETEADFERARHSMVRVGDVKTFNNFSVAVAPGIDVAAFNTVVVWCESFGEFITAAQYR
jgi:hypothetical protein